MMRVLVKGAGVAGLAVAHELAFGGAEVTVVERQPAIGGGATWLAGGMLAPYCERENAEEDVVRLGMLAADWWESALPGSVHLNGTLVVAPSRDRAEIRRFAARTRGYRQLSADEIGVLEPDLGRRFQAGLFFEQEAHLEPRQVLSRLHAKLARAGARLLFGQADPPLGPLFDRTVDCTGIAAVSALPALRGVRGEMLLLEARDVVLSRPVRLLHPRFPVYVVPRGDGIFMVGATMVECADSGPVTARSAMELLNAAYALHPAFGEARIVEMAAGVRPAFADNLPRVVEQDGIVFVNGLYRHGFLMAPALARQVAQLILGEHSGEGENDEAHRQRATA